MWWWFLLSWWCLRFCLGHCEADLLENSSSIIFQHHFDVGCVCMLNGCFSNLTIFALTTTTFPRFRLKDKCRSEQWEVYLCGDMTIKVMESRCADHCGVLHSCISWCDGKAFLGRVHRYARVRAGKGGRRELAPRVFCHLN